MEMPKVWAVLLKYSVSCVFFGVLPTETYNLVGFSHEKSIASAMLFSTKSIPDGTCEIRFACEMLLRNVKCAAARWDLFHFTLLRQQKYFTMTQAGISHTSKASIFHLISRTTAITVDRFLVWSL